MPAVMTAPFDPLGMLGVSGCNVGNAAVNRHSARSLRRPVPATAGRTGSRKIASPPTGLQGTADIGRRPFAGSKSRKQLFDAFRCQRPADRPLLTTSNGHCRP